VHCDVNEMRDYDYVVRSAPSALHPSPPSPPCPAAMLVHVDERDIVPVGAAESWGPVLATADTQMHTCVRHHSSLCF
jgi:hypothetical protein